MAFDAQSEKEQVEGNLWGAISDLAARLKGCDAILAPGRETLTFSALKDRIAATKEALNRLGIGRGDRVAIALPNGPDLAVCLLTSMACATAAPLNPSYTKDEFLKYLLKLKPKAVIVSPGAGASIREAAVHLSIRMIELVRDVTAPAGTFVLRGLHAEDADGNWNAASDIGLILLTSGTTSEEKLVPVAPSGLLSYARGINSVFGLGSSDRSLVLMPLFHASGINSSLIVPLLNGASVVCLEKFEISSFFEHMSRFRPTWITAGYAILKAILDGVDAHLDIVRHSRVRFIRSGTGRLDPKVKLSLERAFHAPVIEQYSTTETGVISCCLMPPEQGRHGTAGRPIVNEVAIVEASGAFTSVGEEGEIVVRGPSVFQGYLDDEEANRAAFIKGWYRTGDLGRMDADGFLTITGRMKDVINRGGEKVSPQELEIVIGRHPAVRDVKAFDIPHPTLGQEVVAAVVLHKDVTASEEALQRFAGLQLAAFKVPRRIFFREAFPLGPSQKIDVRLLIKECKAKLHVERGEQANSLTADLSCTEEVLLSIWRSVLGMQSIGLHENFFLLGGDSLKAVELLVRVEKTFGVELPANAIYNDAATISALAAYIDRVREAFIRIEKSPDEECRSAFQGKGVRSLVAFDDIINLLTFITLAPASWILPSAARTYLCVALSRLHIALKTSSASGLDSALSILGASVTSKELQRRLMANVYEDIVITLREHLRLSMNVPIKLCGAEYLVAAHAAGHGAILWTCPSPFSGLVSKKAYQAVDIRVVSLRSAVHPYSSSWFGMTFLNPLRTRVEDRYLAHTITVNGTNGLTALKQARGYLQKNAIITIAANGAEGKPFEMPFLGGTLKLSLGAPTLAVLHGTPLLPVFTRFEKGCGFQVVIEPPIQVESLDRVEDTAREIARRYAGILETHLQRYPSEWSGWFMRNTWFPGVST